MLKYNKLYHIDCIKGMKQIDDESVNIILADPPYNIGKDFGNNSDKLELNKYLEWSDEWITEAIRILSDDGTLFIYGFSEILSYISVRINLNKRWLVWHYKNKNSAHNTDWQRSHESILVVWKNNRIFNSDDIRTPYSQSYLKNAVGKTRNATPGRFGKKETIYKAHENGAKPRDVIEVPSLAGGAGSVERYGWCKDCNEIFFKKDSANKHNNHNVIMHPTQKPMELTEKLLKSAIKKGQRNLVVVPFAGSGSELVVCKKLDLDFISFEINKDYVKMIELLLNNIQQKSDSNNIFF